MRAGMGVLKIGDGMAGMWMGRNVVGRNVGGRTGVWCGDGEAVDWARCCRPAEPGGGTPTGTPGTGALPPEIVGSAICGDYILGK